MNDYFTFFLDYSKPEQLETVTRLLYPVMVRCRSEQIPFYGFRAIITIRTEKGEEAHTHTTENRGASDAVEQIGAC